MAHEPIDHVRDEIEHWTFFTDAFGGNVHWHLLQIDLGFYKFTLTKFMILELVAAGLIIAIFVPIARKVAAGKPPRGAWWNAFESLLTFVRDQIAKPTLSAPDDYHGHEHDHQQHADAGHGHAAHGQNHQEKKPAEPDYDKYVPFLWTLFLFILFCNLLGLIPFMGSPTASIYMTGALALITFFVMHGAAIARMGFGPYMKSMWPPMEIPVAVGCWLKPMIFVIELAGTFIKAGVLAVRLFANMFAGHMVLAYILSFIVVAASLGPVMWGSVTAASLLGVVALSMLELFVAFLQAYIFTFLAALFTGMLVYPAH